MPNFKVNKPLKLEVFCGDFGLMKAKKADMEPCQLFSIEILVDTTPAAQTPNAPPIRHEEANES